AVAEVADRLAVFDDIGNDVKLRMLLVERLAVRIWAGGIELAEILAKGNELRVRKLLPVENDHKPFVPYIFNGPDIVLRHRRRQIDAADFGAERGVQVPDRYRHLFSFAPSAPVSRLRLRRMHRKAVRSSTPWRRPQSWSMSDEPCIRLASPNSSSARWCATGCFRSAAWSSTSTLSSAIPRNGTSRSRPRCDRTRISRSITCSPRTRRAKIG